MSLLPTADKALDRCILTVNAGSSSLKFAVYPAHSDIPLMSGLADRIGSEGVLRLNDGQGETLQLASQRIETHEMALDALVKAVTGLFPALILAAVGHRVVHGGLHFSEPVHIDDVVLEQLDTLVPFAPLHQPHNLRGVRAARAAFPGVAQVACFDTAFHRRHPWVNDAFALPRSLYAEGVRRYGFHGLSYDYVSGALRHLAPHLAGGRVVVAHLGNGASMCAIHRGQSVASTMGFSALDGLPMGTRCGQVDPGVLLYLMDQKGMSAAEISDLLYSKSGLLGLSGLSSDMRVLEASGAPEAAEAIDYFVLRCQREVGAMAAAMEGIDALVFCGGIGENSALIRERLCQRLGWIGVAIEPQLNRQNALVISPPSARTAVMVVPTNEELMIARAARSIATARPSAKAPLADAQALSSSGPREPCRLLNEA